MDALSISNLAYWFDGCSALTMAEIPYTTPVVGMRAFADCPSLKTVLIYHDGGLSISAGAFSVDDLTILEVRYIPSSSATASVLSSYDWGGDNRAVYFEDVYGLSLLASGHCHYCGGTYSYTLDYEYWTETTHAIRHWCSNCGLDQCEGVMPEVTLTVTAEPVRFADTTILLTTTLCVTTIRPTIRGLDAPIMSTAPTAESILVLV